MAVTQGIRTITGSSGYIVSLNLDGKPLTFTFHSGLDYEFRPQKKKGRECLTSEQGAGQEHGQEAGQGAGQDPDVSFFASQAVSPAQSKLLGASMYPCPAMIPYTVGYYPYPSICPYHPMGLYSSVQIHSSRLNIFSEIFQLANHQ